MKRVVIESPYAGNVTENVAYAKRCALDCLDRKEAPYASHLFFTQPGILDDLDPEQRKLGIEAGLRWGEAAELVTVYIDLGISTGMVFGIVRHVQQGRSIELRALDREVTAEDESLLAYIMRGPPPSLR